MHALCMADEPFGTAEHYDRLCLGFIAYQAKYCRINGVHVTKTCIEIEEARMLEKTRLNCAHNGGLI